MQDENKCVNIFTKTNQLQKYVNRTIRLKCISSAKASAIAGRISRASKEEENQHQGFDEYRILSNEFEQIK